MRRSVLLFACLVVPLAALARDAGTARGTIQFNGKPKKLAYAYAWTEPDRFSTGQINTVVLLSDTKLDDAMLAGRFALIKLARDGKFTGVQVTLDPKGEIRMGTVYTAAEDGYFDVSGVQKWEKKTLTASTIEGKLSTGKEERFFKTRYSYSATFSSPVGPAPKK